MLFILRAFRNLILLSVSALTAGNAFAEPLTYTYGEFAYGIDSSVQILGDSFDSDSSLLANINYSPFEHFYLFAGGEKSDYDLKKVDSINSDYKLTLLSSGIGTYWSLSDTNPVDIYAAISYEHSQTVVEINNDNTSTNRDGAGLRAGLRVQASKAVEISAGFRELSYGTNFVRRHGGLDGLAVEVGTVVEILPHWDLFLRYVTGEMDYKELSGFAVDKEVEVDQDILWLGLRVQA